jgi:TPP-dependent trihydroxycyclohexane-1,2-dione (THcHDO) dehydratase
MIDQELTIAVNDSWHAVKNEFERAKKPDELTVPFLKALQTYRKAVVAETLAQAIDSIQELKP